MSRIRSVPDDQWSRVFGASNALCDFVYVVTEAADMAAGPTKIGIAKNPMWRMSSMQAGNPRRLAMVAIFQAQSREHAFAIEQTVLKGFSRSRGSGEWLDAAPSKIVDAIKMVA